jgi:hypothetical protein
VLLVSRGLADFPAPEYVLDLDQPAFQRWQPLLENAVKLKGWEYTYAPVIGYMTGVLPMEDWKKHDWELQMAGLALFGQEYFEEIRGMYAKAEELGYGQNVTTGMLVFFQLFYELDMECTGILARDEDGNVVHGRNMDIGLPVQNITAQVTWVRGGEPLLVTTQYLGYLGVHTGMRKGGWSVQANERVVLEPGPWGWQKTILAHDVLSILEGHTPVGYSLRQTLLNVATFEDAITALSDTKLVSPLYFIVAGAGVGEGAVVTRARSGLANNSNSVIRLSNEKWNIVQTNWDNWMPIDKKQCLGTVAALPQYARDFCRDIAKVVFGDPTGCNAFCGLMSDGRAEAGRAAMAQLKPTEVDFDHIEAIMGKAPVNNGGTIFTSLIDPHTNSYKTVIRQHDADTIFKEPYFMELRKAQFLAAFRALLKHIPVISV